MVMENGAIEVHYPGTHGKPSCVLTRRIDDRELITRKIQLHMQRLAGMRHGIISGGGIVVGCIDLPRVARPGRMGHP